MKEKKATMSRLWVLPRFPFGKRKEPEAAAGNKGETLERVGTAASGAATTPKGGTPSPALNNSRPQAAEKTISGLFFAQREQGSAKASPAEAAKGNRAGGSPKLSGAGTSAAQPSAREGAAAAKTAGAESSVTSDLGKLFGEDNVGNEELCRLANSLGEVDIYWLSRQCREISGRLKGI